MNSPSQTSRSRNTGKYLKSILWSWDFVLGSALGSVLGFLVARFDQLQGEIAGILAGIGGVSAGVVALIVTSLSSLLAVLSAPYIELLQKLPSGSVGVVKPFLFTAGLAAISSAAAFTAAVIFPLTTSCSWGVFLVVAIPFGLFLWSIFGCVQVTNQLVQHWKNTIRLRRIS